jgi:hypothetical protein
MSQGPQISADTIRRRYSVSILQATQDSPQLARLTMLTMDSSARLKAIESLIPFHLRPAIKAGPIDGDNWCLLVDSNAAAAKLRQMLPSLLACLRTKGWEIDGIRLKVQTSRVTSR